MNDNVQVGAQVVIERLAARVAELTVQVATLEAVLAKSGGEDA